MRAPAIRVAIFNHKGGVGKTTLTVNLCVALARMGKRVLMVDADPQCNLTAHMIEETVVDDLLDKSDGEDGETIWTSMRPINNAEGNVRYVEPYESFQPNLFILPGDVRLSEFEEHLNSSWAECWQRKVRGFRGFCAISELVNQISIEEKIDFVFYDAGPNIGPLNRAIILDCDFFIPSVACDLFSLRALKTLGRTLLEWIEGWQTLIQLAPKGVYVMPGTPIMLGYIPQRFKIYRQTVARNQARYLKKIDKAISTEIVEVLKNIKPSVIRAFSGQVLGQVKDFGGLVPASQLEGTSIFDVSTGTDVQRTEAKETFKAIAVAILKRTGN